MLNSDFQNSIVAGEQDRRNGLSTGNRLLHFHVKLRVLQLDIEKDAVVNELDPAEGWVVFRYILYPPVHRKTGSFASSAF